MYLNVNGFIFVIDILSSFYFNFVILLFVFFCYIYNFTSLFSDVL